MSGPPGECAILIAESALALAVGLVAGVLLGAEPPPEPVRPERVIRLFNGKDLTGLTTWLRDTKRADPRRVFRVTDGLLHVTGDGFGYLAAETSYRDYRVVLEHKWGRRTDGSPSASTWCCSARRRTSALPRP